MNSAAGCFDDLGFLFLGKTSSIRKLEPFCETNLANLVNFREFWLNFGGNLAKLANFGGIAPCQVNLGYFGDFGIIV